jgi:DnaJ-domain-containing protein 1
MLAHLPGPGRAIDVRRRGCGRPCAGPTGIDLYHAVVTYYEVLGVAPDASAADVRRAYFDRARLHHPDFHTTDDAPVRRAAEREMQRINDAWAVLSDPGRRRAYDATLRSASGPDRGVVVPPEDGWDPRSGAAHPDFVPVDGDEDDPDYNALLDELDDNPYRGARPVPRWQQLLPVVLFLAAVACLSIGLVVSLTPLLGAAVLLFLASGVSFVLTPMLAVLRGFERDPEK